MLLNQIFSRDGFPEPITDYDSTYNYRDCTGRNKQYDFGREVAINRTLPIERLISKKNTEAGKKFIYSTGKESVEGNMNRLTTAGPVIILERQKVPTSELETLQDRNRKSNNDIITTERRWNDFRPVGPGGTILETENTYLGGMKPPVGFVSKRKIPNQSPLGDIDDVPQEVIELPNAFKVDTKVPIDAEEQQRQAANNSRFVQFNFIDSWDDPSMTKPQMPSQRD